MKSGNFYRSLAATVALLSAGCIAQSASAQKIENSYICVFNKDAVPKGQVRAEAVRSANAQGGTVTRVYETAIRGFAARLSPQGAANLKARNPRIAYCEQDQVMKIVQRRGKPGGGETMQQQVPWGIAYVKGGVSGATGRAWVIDSGIDGDHPDLNVNASLSANFARGNSWDDGNGHGTHVAGTIAAIDNGQGVIGVAAGAQVIAVRVLDKNGSGSVSGVIAGVDYVAAKARDGDVANMRLGGGVSTALDTAVANAAADGATFVLAAGNESDNVRNHSPARVNAPNVFTVSAFGQGAGGSALWASYSNFGAGIDYAEPGSGILSTYMGGGYASLSGTSMATPHLAGLLLLGAVRNGGTVTGDPDGIYEPIGIH